MDGVTPTGSPPEAEPAPAAGDPDSGRAALVAAFAEARTANDAEAMAAAALAMPSSQRFGVYPGQIPALLHEAYDAADSPSTRCRLAAALARSWVYGGDATRAARFAEDAERLAAEVATPEAAADALDAALLAHWGPDDFSQRLSLAARLVDVAAHVVDPELRLSAHLWRLTTAWECLDIVAVQRQLRALDVVAEESGSSRVAFFAASRRAMYALAIGDAAAAEPLIGRTAAVGAELAEPDVEAVLHELEAMRAQITCDLVALQDEAIAHEAFGAAEGIPSISADAAALWLAAGQPEQAARLVAQLTAGGVDGIARDVDFLLTVTSLVGVAAAVGMDDVTREGADALEPYAGRGVLNAGAVSFHGVVDDYLFRARRALGAADAEQWRHAAQHAYRRLGAGWWERGLHELRRPPAPTPTRCMYLRRADDGAWSVGSEGATFVMPDLKGLQYLRYLVERPGSDVEALSLSDAAAGHPGTALAQSDLGDALDDAALAAYRRRLRELDAELDTADRRADQPRATQLSAERDALVDQLRAAAGLGGRSRRPGGSAERARIAVRKAITSALSRIELHDASVARVLRDSIHTGVTCRYDPNPDHPVKWMTV